MRGYRYDYYTATPQERVPLQTWPADFDPTWIDVYANKPLTREVRECECCPLRAVCVPEHFAKPECAEQDRFPSRLFGRKNHVTNGRARDETAQMVLAVLADAPASITQIADRLHVGYWTLYDVMRDLERKRLVYAVDVKRSRNRGKLYALTGEVVEQDAHADAMTTQRRRIYETMQMGGGAEVTITQLVERTGIGRTSVRCELSALQRAGYVESRQVAGGPRPGDRKLYRIVEGAG